MSFLYIFVVIPTPSEVEPVCFFKFVLSLCNHSVVVNVIDIPPRNVNFLLIFL